MPFASAQDGAKLYWERHGKGPPLVLAAGLGGVGSYWNANLADLSRTYSTYVFDQRGTGRSSPVAVKSIEEMATDLIAILDDAGIVQAHVVGHSTGGAIGVSIALDFPERVKSLVIYASTTCGDRYRQKLLNLRSEILESLGVEAYASLSSLLLYPPYWINAHAEAVSAAEANVRAQLGPPEVQASRLQAILNFDRRHELGRLLLPVLVLCADDDILTPRYFSEEYARLISDARTHWEPRGGHALSQTEPARFLLSLLSFLRDVDRSTR